MFGSQTLHFMKMRLTPVWNRFSIQADSENIRFWEIHIPKGLFLSFFLSLSLSVSLSLSKVLSLSTVACPLVIPDITNQLVHKALPSEIAYHFRNEIWETLSHQRWCFSFEMSYCYGRYHQQRKTFLHTSNISHLLSAFFISRSALIYNSSLLFLPFIIFWPPSPTMSLQCTSGGCHAWQMHAITLHQS